MATHLDSPSTIPHYEQQIIPAESVAKAAREGVRFGHVDHDDQNEPEHLPNRDSYTIDQSGLINALYGFRGLIVGKIVKQL